MTYLMVELEELILKQKKLDVRFIMKGGLINVGRNI